MTEERIWTVNVVFTEDGDATRADAVLQSGSMDLRGWGRARRNPAVRFLFPDITEVSDQVVVPHDG